jgi:hypothetical protein
MKSIYEEVKNLKDSSETFVPSKPSPELQKYSKGVQRYITSNQKEFEIWGGWTPKLLYRMFYTFANKIFSHEPSTKESLYAHAPRIKQN